MLTSNFRTLMSLVLQSNSNGVVKGMLPIRNVVGDTYYAANQIYNSMPSATNTDFTLNATNTGISVGSGTTAAAESDYQLEAPIVNGLACSLIKSCGLDSDGYPYLQIDMMMLNTSSEPITIAEIGYKQNLRCSNTEFGTSISDRTCLLDRTVLATPVTIAAGDYKIIRYTIKTVIPSGE